MKKKAGNYLFSIVTKNHSFLDMIGKIARATSRKFLLSASLRREFSTFSIPIHLKQRDLATVLRFLAGVANCHYTIDKDTIVFFKTNNVEEIAQNIIIGHKKDLLSGNYKNIEQPSVYFSLGLLLYLRKKPKAALKEFSILFTQFPQSSLVPKNLLFMARCFLSIKEYTKARRTITYFLNHFSRSEFKERAFILLAECHQQEGKFLDSGRIYQYLLNQTNAVDQANIYFRLGQVYSKQGHYSQAIPFFDKIIQSKENSLKAKALYEKIRCQIALKKYDSASASIRVFYELFPKHLLASKIKLYHSKIEFKAKRYFHAYYLLKPLRKNPDKDIRLEALILISRTLEKLGLYDLLIQTLERGISGMQRKDRQLISLYYEIACVYKKTKQWEKAKLTYQKIIGRYSDVLYLDIMECDFYAENYRGCLRQFEKFKDIIQSRKILSEAFHLAGKCFVALEEIDKAKLAFEGKWQYEED